MSTHAPVLELTGATVRFGADTVLDGVDLRLRAGEVHALMGENGAGKSTLIKAITGALPLTSGTMRLDGRETSFASPHAAQRAGIGVVHQEIDLLPNLTVAENITLGREPRRHGLIDWSRAREVARTALAGLGLDVDPGAVLGAQSLAVQQLVAIARATSTDVRVLVLDEPTSSLDSDECAELFRVMDDLRGRGVAILFVSHFLEQVYEVCDRVTVLRDGQLVGEYPTRELLRIDLVQAMIGRDPDDLPQRPRAPYDTGPAQRRPFLSARAVTAGSRIDRADVDLVEGEVLGIAGLLGAGRTELARALTGIDPLAGGTIEVEGRTEQLDGPRSAIRLGVVYSSEDRRHEGIISELSVQDNIVLALQAERGALRRISAARSRELATSWIDALDIRPADPDRAVGTLSGGNQQKVLLARLLALAPRALVLDEPTRGIDVGAKAEVTRLVGELADNGLSIMFISVELEEVLRVCDRIAVVRDGRVSDTVASDELTPDTLLALVAQPGGAGD